MERVRFASNIHHANLMMRSFAFRAPCEIVVERALYRAWAVGRTQSVKLLMEVPQVNMQRIA